MAITITLQPSACGHLDIVVESGTAIRQVRTEKAAILAGIKRLDPAVASELELAPAVVALLAGESAVATWIADPKAKPLVITKDTLPAYPTAATAAQAVEP